jgi:GNAT superfamily N-acetyltransferase
VLPEHRRKGIGTTLIRHIEVEAAKMGLKRLTVSCVFDEAGWAKSFYVKLGYKVGDMIALPWGGSAHLYEKALV